MTFIAQAPTNKDIATPAPSIAAGLSSTFRPNLNAYVQAIEAKAQKVQAFLEQLTSLLGNGAVSGGTITAGSGLSVSVAALSAIVGNIVAFDAPQVVGGLVANATNYLFLRQDGTWTVNQTGVTPTDIVQNGNVAGRGAFLLWGTVVCGAASVTSVDNTRTQFTGAHSAPYPLRACANGLPASGSALERFVTTDAFSLPVGFSRSQAIAGTAATANAVFTVQKNGTTIGTITFAAGSTVGTFAAASAVSFVPGDVLTILAPGTQDTTLADVAITLRGQL